MWPHERGADPDGESQSQGLAAEVKASRAGFRLKRGSPVQEAVGNHCAECLRIHAQEGNRHGAPIRGSPRLVRGRGPSPGLLVNLRALGARPSPVPAPGCARAS